MADPVSVVLVGIGGYGEEYVSALLDEEQGKRCKIVGVVDPEPAGCSRLGDIKSTGIPVFASLDLFFKESDADLAVISSLMGHRSPNETGVYLHVLPGRGEAAGRGELFHRE